MGRYAVSIEDIARAAGVSHSTVSRALRHSALISPDVRSRIQRMAGEMGYTPNALAQSLQTRRSQTLGLVVPSIADPFFTEIVRGVEEAARPARFSVFLSASYNDVGQETAVIDTLYARRVEGLLIASLHISSNYAERLRRVTVPTVLLNNEAAGDRTGLHWVRVDDHLGARLATEHLIQLGHRAIGYMGVANRPRSHEQRLAGYRAALEAAGITAREGWVAQPLSSEAPATVAGQEADVAAGQALLPQMLAQGVTAVFCFNDMVAVGALLGCRARGLVVPDDLSLVGFDDVEVARYMAPPLTTIHQPRVRLGTLATEMLLDQLAARPVTDQVLPPHLVVRGSTAPAPAHAGRAG
ncbi:MAG TPA: LacI family DNA-binding transcriptional regulator [Chloroflexia bacterium]|nr:LacI family DNA-binding transcriptional regulator [Chloroflexia bacterium]